MSRQPVKFGLLWPLRNAGPWGRPLPDLYDDTLAEVVAAEELGYDSAWVTEHHFCDDDYLPAVMPMLAAMAVRTSRIRLGPYVLLTPLHHPVRLAEDAAVVDNLSRGRLELAMGLGYREEEFAGLAIDRRTRGRAQGEATEIMLRAWSDEPLDFDGEVFSFHGIQVTPKPVQRPIPIYLGGVHPAVLERVARLGVTGVAGRPKRADMETFNAQLTEHGRDPESISYLPFVFLWVDRDHERAKRVASPFTEWVVGNYQRWFAAAGTPMFTGAVEDHCIMGNPAYCIEKLEEFLAKGEHAPVSRLILQPPLLGLDHAESLRMIETFATEVAPHFTGVASTSARS